MHIDMDEALSQTSLTIHADLSIDGLQRHRWKESFDDRYCLELFHRALSEQTDQAWCELQQCFSDTIRRWIHTHPYQDVALRRDSEENYIAQTFSRFWCAVHTNHLEFATLHAALSYLHATLNGIMIDTLRSHLRLRAREMPLPEPGSPVEPAAEVSIDSHSLWKNIRTLLPDERERRLMYLLYYCGLKPREIVLRCPQEFDEVQEIYRLNHIIIERLRRNRDQVRYVLDYAE